MGSNMIHKSAIVGENVRIGSNVKIGAFTTVHDNVVIGDGTEIDGYCEIGYPSALATSDRLVIGSNSRVRSHSVIYSGSVFGNGLVTGHRVTVRENVTAGENLQIGTLSDFQGDCRIGDFVRTHSNVHLGKKSVLGNFVWVFPYVVLTNDPHPPSDTLLGVTVHDFAVIATMSVILPGVSVGEHSLVGAHSLVKDNVDAHSVVAGVPARRICKANEIKLTDGSGRPAYPWPGHFHRGYPDSLVEAWQRKYQESGN